ncbi:MAG: hypothetical protein GKR94_15090 [Gammaproteobacteria bacterium]|nr:hypothetical protein [Gammaproteobacteria bacterium]
MLDQLGKVKPFLDDKKRVLFFIDKDLNDLLGNPVPEPVDCQIKVVSRFELDDHVLAVLASGEVNLVPSDV